MVEFETGSVRTFSREPAGVQLQSRSCARSVSQPGSVRTSPDRAGRGTACRRSRSRSVNPRPGVSGTAMEPSARAAWAGR